MTELWGDAFVRGPVATCNPLDHDLSSLKRVSSLVPYLQCAHAANALEAVQNVLLPSAVFLSQDADGFDEVGNILTRGCLELFPAPSCIHLAPYFSRFDYKTKCPEPQLGVQQLVDGGRGWL